MTAPSATGRPRLLVIGEALVDVVSMAGRSGYAHPGGSPANVSVGAARLGIPTALLTRLGRDDAAGVIAEHMAANGVALFAAVDGAPTNVAEAHVDAAGQAHYELRMTWDLPSDALARADTSHVECVHTGSVAATLLPGAAAVQEIVAALRGRATVSYDPNCRPSQMGPPESVRESIEALVASADVVKASHEDLEFLYPGAEPSTSAQRWLSSGPGLVVLTSGAAGYTAWTSAGTVSGPAVAVTVVDTVGAGDAFMSALLAGLSRRELLGATRRAELRAVTAAELRGVLAEAATAAAITCTRPGADPPDEAELATWLSSV